MYKEIFELINKGEINKAQEQVEKISDDDPKKYNLKGLIHFNKKELEKAKEEFEKGLKINPIDSDLLFNYGYLLKEMNQEMESWRYLVRIHDKDWATYDLLGDIEFKNRSKLASLRFYLKAAELTDNPQMKKKFLEIRNKIKKDTKIAFLCLPGLDNFLKDIVETFSLGYDVKLVISTDANEITEAIKWADIVWLEWANELAIFATNKVPEIENKKVICRLHGYEAFNANVLNKINWDLIDRMIFVADHVKEDAYESCPQIKNVPYTMVYNGINLDKFIFSKRAKGKRICFSGHVNYKKNPMLIIQILEKLLKIDDDYRIDWVGDHQDIRIKKYLNYILKDMGIEDRFTFHDWTNDINSWLEDKNYFLSTSIHEGYGVAIMEAMARGIKPIIHNFYAARGFYPDDLIYNTIDEAVEKITEESYDSESYRRFIEDNYTLEEQILNILLIINDLEYGKKKILSQKRNYTKENSTPDYTYANRYVNRNFKKIQMIINNLPGTYNTALDIGCNQGYILKELLRQKKIKKGYGLDLDKTLLDKELLDNDNFEFYENNIMDFKFPKTYDLILYLSVHHHIFGKYGSKTAFELFNKIVEHCNQTLIFESGMISELGPYLYWKDEIKYCFNSDLEHLQKLTHLIGPRLKKVEIIGQLPIHNSTRPIIKFSFHPLGSKYDLRVDNEIDFYGNYFLENENDFEIIDEFKRTIGSKNQKLISINKISTNERSHYRIFDETYFYKVKSKKNSEIYFAKKIVVDKFKQLREFLVLTQISHPKIIKLIGVSRNLGLIFPYLDWQPLDSVNFKEINNKNSFIKEINTFFDYASNKQISMGILDYESEVAGERRLIDIVDFHCGNFLLKITNNKIEDWRVVDFEYYSNNNFKRNLVNKQIILNKILHS